MYENPLYKSESGRLGMQRIHESTREGLGELVSIVIELYNNDYLTPYPKEKIEKYLNKHFGNEKWKEWKRNNNG